MLNSQILVRRILGFGATSTKKQGNQEKHQHPERKSTAPQSHLIPIQIFFLWYEEFVNNNFTFVENPSHSS